MNETGNFRSILLLIALGSIWGSSFAIIKVGVETVPPMSLAALRIILGAMVLYGYVRLKGMRLPRSLKFWKQAFVVGLFGNALPFTLIGWGELTIDSGPAAILMAVMPLGTLVLVHLFTADERLTALKLMGILTGFLGVVVLVGPEAVRGLGGHFMAQLAVAGGALCYAVASTAATHMPAMHPAQRGVPVLVLAAIQMIPLSLWFDQPWTLSPNFASLTAGIYLGLIPTALATIIYFHLITVRGATFVALNNYMVPLIGVIWGWLWLSENVTSRQLIALTLILLGIAITNLRPLRIHR